VCRLQIAATSVKCDAVKAQPCILRTGLTVSHTRDNLLTELSVKGVPLARVLVKVKVCDRCPKGKEKTAVSTERFTWQGSDYELELCQTHLDMLTRELGAWLRLAKDCTSIWQAAWEPSRPAVRTEATVLRPATAGTFLPSSEESKLRATLSEPGLPDTARNWNWTTHAEERLRERGERYGFTRNDVLWAVERPEWVTRTDDGLEHRTRGKVRAVVDVDTQVIITIKVSESALAGTREAFGDRDGARQGVEAGAEARG
jgi:hypothetical protein